MLPNRIGEVHKMDDLKNLKGGMDSRDTWRIMLQKP